MTAPRPRVLHGADTFFLITLSIVTLAISGRHPIKP